MSTKGFITYKKVLYKYKLAETYEHKLSFTVPNDIITEYIELYKDGTLIIKKDYAWDGPSGLTFDDDSNMRGSCIHDSGYQLLRAGLLEELYRDKFDEEFKKVCLEDDMDELRAEIYFLGVHVFGEQYAKRQEEKIFIAPSK